MQAQSYSKVAGILEPDHGNVTLTSQHKAEKQNIEETSQQMPDYPPA